MNVIYIDLNKAFDSVKRFPLIRILNESNLNDLLSSWIKFYLSDRYQYVDIFGIKSNLFLASSGVLQERHLYTLLFSVFINSAHRLLCYSRIICFAHDIKHYSSICTIDECLTLQDDFISFLNGLE